MNIHTQIESALGLLLLTSREGKLTGLYFAERPHSRFTPEGARQDDAEIFTQTARQLEEYASGTRQSFELPLDYLGTAFQTRVWTAIAAIPFGETVSYGELAARIGSPDAVRAVGTATGANRISWIIPCHRVVGKCGTLTGYAGGLPRKSALLDFEAGKVDALTADILG